MEDKISCGSELKILFLEDTPQDAEIIRELIIDSGYNLEMDITASANEFESFLRTRNYDIILSDFNLPGFDAFGSLKLCNEICPNIPFICVSGTIGEETAIELLKLGAVDYVLKDKPGRLPFAIRRALVDAKEKISRIQTEKSLRESEKRYKRFFEEDLTGDYITSPEGKVLFCNDALAKILKYNSKEDLLTHNIVEFYVDPKDRALLIDELKSKKKIANLELSLKAKDGSALTVIENVIGSFDDNGELTQIIGYLFDITERKNIEIQLHDQTKLLTKVLNILPVGIWITDNKGKIVHGNPAGQKIWAGAKYVGIEQFGEYKGWWLDSGKLIEPDEWAVARAFTKKETSLNEEIEIECFDGTRKIILNSAVPILDSKDEVIAAIVTNQDITEKKRIVLNLQKLNRAIEQSSVSVMITDSSGNIEYVNPFFTKATGYTFDEVKGKNPNILNSGHQSKTFYEELWNTILSGNVWQGEMLNKKKNAELFWEKANISPVTNPNGAIVNFVAVKEDITERKRILEELISAKEKAEESDKLKSQFLAQMSHEIRTPINVVIGHHSLIREFIEEDFAEEYKDIFDGIESSSRRIIRTIDLILNMAEMQTGRYAPTFTQLDLHSHIFSRLLSEFKSAIELKHLTFHYNNNLTRNNILVDEYSVMQIFTNLIDNAIKYTHKGSITINLFNNQNNKTVVEITDTGIGMSGDFLSNLFEPFSQEEKGYSRAYEGNGLGLSLVKEYCKINNALIQVESEKDHGSTFRIIFNGKE